MFKSAISSMVAFSSLSIMSILLSVAIAAPKAVLKKIGHPSLLSPHANPITVFDGKVFVVNSQSDTVDIIDPKSSRVIFRVPVGIDPVSLAVRPDGKELWVANHVSDTVSVIDIASKSRTYLSIIATIQDLDYNTKSTNFDEPVGIAFANNNKAYVALSSENKIAVINSKERKVKKYLSIPAQEPRAIKVRNGKLYVIPFESNNKSQLSGGKKIDGNLVTFDAYEHSIKVNNVLSLGHVVDIIKHPDVPDKDLFIFDTKTDRLIKTVESVGTLLYGLTIDSKGNIFVAQTDARNDANGRSGTKKHGLAELENRAFLNQITKINAAGGKNFINLEPLPPKHPKPNEALATPFAIEISPNNQVLYVTAAGSDKFFTLDSRTGKILSEVKVDATPRGIALSGLQAWIYNAVANTVTRVDISKPKSLRVISKTVLTDPTPQKFKRGRIAFNKAAASSTGTFSCASCHPDGHTDQLLWVLKTPIVTGGKQIMPRSTMPIRGLRDTAPFHWDGIPGDPYGGNNSASIHKPVKPNSDIKNPESAARHLIDGGLASTMKLVSDKNVNDEGKEGYLSKKERDDMATFLLSVTYPPAPKRAYTNRLSKRAAEGFELFHIKGNFEDQPKPNVCGDCHRMPFLVSTNTPGSGMDTPTWRGAYDRFLILPQGRLNIIEFDFYKRIANQGIPEKKMWRLSWKNKERFDPVWDMVLEGSTGYSGSFARQVTLNKETVSEKLTEDTINALEDSAREGAIILQVEGIFKSRSEKVVLQFTDEHYLGTNKVFKRSTLFESARRGEFIGTFSGRHGDQIGLDDSQPALWTLGPIHAQIGKQKFPILTKNKKSMLLSGRHIKQDARVIVNGRRVKGAVEVLKNERLRITLQELPKEGIHFLQVQNPGGLFSNDFIFNVSTNTPIVSANRGDLHERFIEAVRQGNLAGVRQLLSSGAQINQASGNDKTSALGVAAFNGQTSVASFLISKGAQVSQKNKDGNTPLHIAAFMCHRELSKLLMSKGANLRIKNNKGERPIDVVSGGWSDELSKFYLFLNGISVRKKGIEKYKELRPVLAKILRQ